MRLRIGIFMTNLFMFFFVLVALVCLIYGGDLANHHGGCLHISLQGAVPVSRPFRWATMVPHYVGGPTGPICLLNFMNSCNSFYAFLCDFMNISGNFINFITFAFFVIFAPTEVHSMLKLIAFVFSSGGLCPPS